MKKIFSIFLLIAMCGLAEAQTTITVTGNIKNNTGDYLRYAFIQDKQYKYATYSDSLGNFNINANPASKLLISCYGYKDTVVDVNNKANFNIVMYPKTTGSAAVTRADDDGMTKRAVLQDTFSPNSNSGDIKNNFSADAMLPEINTKEATEGSRYLFPHWVHGYVVNTKDSIIQNPGFLFNYDKIGGGLLLTQDKVSAILVDKAPIKSFTLYDDSNIPYTFENLPAIDKNHYVEVLASGKKYRIYKTITTKFVKADYVTNGISSSGNNFDSFQDTYEYYVLNLQNNSFEKLQLKRKSIKNDFANEEAKVDKFIDDHSSDTIDDIYLANLANYMNE